MTTHDICLLFVVLLAVGLSIVAPSDVAVDPNGYLLFCLCMGRLGNQAEHFLGGLSFAKRINRTLILPPWRTDRNVDFEDWFKPEALAKYHRVITARKFMKNLAPKVWPPDRRIGFCYSGSKEPCEMKIGNPFTNFWDELHVDFTHIVTQNITHYHPPHQWKQYYPPEVYPVIAMRGAPASFPMTEADSHLQVYMEFSKKLQKELKQILEKYFEGQNDFVGIHLRNEVDWERACEHAELAPRFMASYMCVGFDYHRKYTKEMCLPSKNLVLQLTRQIVLKENVTRLYIATDKHAFVSDFKAVLPRVQVVHHNPHMPIVDIAVLSEAKHFIGTCGSSFSSLVWRQRKEHKKGPSTLFVKEALTEGGGSDSHSDEL